MSSRSGARHPWALSDAPFNEVFVGLALLVSAYISILLTRVPGGFAPFFPGCAIAAALLIRLPRIRWSIAAASVVTALIVTNVAVAHRPWPLAALFTGVNVAEIAMMVAAFRFAWVFPYPDITIGQAAIVTAIFGIAIPGIAGLAGGLLLHAHYASPFLEGSLRWW